MDRKQEIDAQTNLISKMEKKSEVVSKPFLEWKFRVNEETGEKEFDTISLSDGSQINHNNVSEALERATGTSDIRIGERILKKIAKGMSSKERDVCLNDVTSLLSALQPKNEAEAMLFGQFLALQDSGMRCLTMANLPDQGFYHIERFFILANKLFNTANQTIQTLSKYRSGGQQTVQVVHVHNDGQAIVAQNFSPASSPKEGI